MSNKTFTPFIKSWSKRTLLVLSSAINQPTIPYKLIAAGALQTLIEIYFSANSSTSIEAGDNQKPKFILIDNIEFLNLNSINALLKSLEEPGENIYFFLIQNNKKTLDTLKSRCLNYKINLTHQQVIEISNKLINTEIYNFINDDLLDYYITPGKIYDLINFSINNKIDLKSLKLESFLNLIIDNSYYKKESCIKYMIFDFVELLLKKKFSINNYGLFSYFLKKIENTYKFNLDEESLFLEFKAKVING